MSTRRDTLTLQSHYLRVTCRACGHVWTYSGRTPYAQCSCCGRSNNLSDPDVDYDVLGE